MGFGVRLAIKPSNDLTYAMTMLDKKAPGVLAAAMRKATRPIKAAAQSLAPLDIGLLRKAIGSRGYVTRNRDAVIFIGEVLVKRGFGAMVTRKGKKKPMYADPFKYAHLVELGTQPHALGSGSQVWAKRPDKRGQFGIPGMQRGRMHPGSKAAHFMQRALEQNEAAALAILEEETMKGLEKLWEQGG